MTMDKQSESEFHKAIVDYFKDTVKNRPEVFRNAPSRWLEFQVTADGRTLADCTRAEVGLLAKLHAAHGRRMIADANAATTRKPAKAAPKKSAAK